MLLRENFIVSNGSRPLAMVAVRFAGASDPARAAAIKGTFTNTFSILHRGVTDSAGKSDTAGRSTTANWIHGTQSAIDGGGQARPRSCR